MSLALAAVVLVGARPAAAAALAPAEGYELVRRAMSEERRERKEAARRLTEAGDLTLVPALVDALFFSSRLVRPDLFALLANLTGEKHTSYRDWVEYVGRREDLAPKEGYPGWKLSLLERIDPNYRKIFYPGAPARIRVEEIVWGGVPVDGIPSLDDPPVVPASEARYLTDRERVFGVSLGGESRAYPLRFLDWHEMLNDTAGGVPVTLSYCTLCGSGILYDSRTPAGGRYTFGTSGLLYRSNKLMFDRGGYSLWSNLTGEPVVGRLARSSIRLPILPLTLTTWEDWRRRHPDTTVLDLKGVQQRMAGRFAFDYRPGAADQARAGVAFPVWLKSDALDRDAEVFAIRLAGGPKAYPIELVLRERVVNDTLGGEALVLVGDPQSGAVRAYRRGEHRFRPAPDPAQLLDEAGLVWTVEEAHLVPTAKGAETPAVPSSGAAAPAPLERLPGHVAFWFGWYGFYPQTELYTGPSA